jgi:DNA-directed RNA polymerase delta subunit
MDGDELKHWFDQAYSHMTKGDFASAAKCFEHVINDSGDSNASRIAEQRLRWYCLPIEAILNRMQECPTPIDVHNFLAEFFSADSQYLGSEQQAIIPFVESELAKLSSVIRIGDKIWVKRDIYCSQVDQLAQAIIHSSRPLSISTWLSNQFHAYEPLDNYPDHITLGVFELGLHGYPIIIIAQEYAISKTVLSAKIDSLATQIRTIEIPVALNLLTGTLFPEIPTELVPQTTNSLRSHLDSRFVEVAAGIVFLIELMKLNNDLFEDVFQSFPLPLTTEMLVCARLFPGQATHPLTQQFHSLAENQLAQNQYLRQVQRSFWISKRRESDLYNQVDTYLHNVITPQTIQDILENIWPRDSINILDRIPLINLLEAHMKISQDVIMVGKQFWLHITIVKQALEKSYQQLLDSPEPLTAQDLLTFNLDIEKTFITPGLCQIFENLLLKDSRFVSEAQKKPRLWRAVDPRYRDNHAAIQVLSQARKWLSLEELASLITSEQGILSPIFDLNADDHFKLFSQNRWGLKDWVSINDLTYEYLLESRQALHEVTIRGFICQRYNIKEENAIFTPLEDPHFVQDSLNRWFCRHALSPDELDLIHEKLIKYGGSGRKLENLIRQVLHLNPDSTDAQIRLQVDKRFIYLDGLWFAYQAAFYALVPSDVDKIFNCLATLPDSRGAISLKELVYQTIGHDGRLTDASAWLRQDKRFKEVHEGFWALSIAPIPDFERSGIGKAIVHHPSRDEDTESRNLGAIGSDLTPRKGKSTTEKESQEPRKKEYITLTHLDILHGNLRIAGMLKRWIPIGVNNIHFIDEQDYEFIAYIDETGSILNIREWLEYRSLTYGDKIFIQPAPQTEGLFIRPYGERDERVYQEALEHQEIEKLIDEARSVNKDFHDLMIEVMDAFDNPLHREDIYQLVNYQRTASRNTIYEILSLPDCPFEELRYFVPGGEGSWRFDRKRKEAYDMKMQELITENAALHNQMLSLREQLESQQTSSEEIRALSTQSQHLRMENAELQKNIEKIIGEKSDVELVNLKLDLEVEALEKQMAVLRSKIDESQAARQQIQTQSDQEIAQLQQRLNTFTNELSSLQIKSKDAQGRATQETYKVEEQLKTQTKELEQMARKFGILEDRLASEHTSKESLQKEIEQLTRKSAAKTEKLEADLVVAEASKVSLQRDIEQLRYESAAKIGQLEAELAATQKSKEWSQDISRPAPKGIKGIIQTILKLLFRHKTNI